MEVRAKWWLRIELPETVPVSRVVDRLTNSALHFAYHLCFDEDGLLFVQRTKGCKQTRCGLDG